MASIDPTAYYNTGKYLTDLGTRLNKANTDLTNGLSGCGGMAGNYDDAKKWAQSYDQSADSVIDNTRSLAETLQHFGSLVSWAGYNHELANYNSNISTTRGAPPTAPPPVPAPAADACYLDSPGAFGGSGHGLQTDIPNLLEDIGIPVPDGDTTLLDNAAAAWHTFITSEAIQDAMDLSLLGAIRFEHVDSPEVPDIQDHLATLARCAIDIQDTGNRLRQACGDHSTGLTQLRTTLHDLLRDLDIQLGLTIAITIFTSFLSAGTSTGVGTATAATEIATTAARMTSAIRDLRIVERITQTFKDVKDLSLAKTKSLLSAILGIKKVSVVDEDIVPAVAAAAKDLTDADRAALADYTGPGYRELNEALRGGTVTPVQQSRVDAINSALSKLPDFKGVVVRGTDLPASVLAKYQPGQIVTEDAFTSTSNDAGVANSFGSRVQFRIVSNSGKDVSPYSSYPEQEILFPAGTKFFVTGRSMDPSTGKTIIEMMQR